MLTAVARQTRFLFLLALVLSQVIIANVDSDRIDFWGSIETIEQSSAQRHTHHAASPHTGVHLVARSPVRNTGPSSSTKCSRPVSRVSWYSMSSQEKQAWIQHFKLLSTIRGKSIFVKGGTFMDDLAVVHVGMQQEMHYNACFLPCHSAFLRAFYTLMRLTGYRGREAYWPVEQDAAASQGLPGAEIWSQTSFGSDDGRGGGIPNGPFRGLKCGILPDTRSAGRSLYKPHLVTRHFNDDWNRKPKLQKGDMYGHLLQPSLFAEIMETPNYTTFRQRLERSVHAFVHQSMGGEMWLYSAVCEPVFWLLHAEIDRIWRSWQTKHNTWNQYGGNKRIRDSKGAVVIQPASQQDIINFFGMFEAIKVSDVMHPRKGILCFRYDHLYGGIADISE